MLLGPFENTSRLLLSPKRLKLKRLKRDKQEVNSTKRSKKQAMLQGIYSPVKAMGFSAMFIFHL
jgi:hypothetical protein